MPRLTADKRFRPLILSLLLLWIFPQLCSARVEEGTIQERSSGGADAIQSDEALGDLFIARGQYQSAIVAYSRVAEKSPILWNKLGVAYQHLYAFDQAASDYRKALHLWPHYPDALNNLGTIYYAQKDFHRAEKFYRQALKHQPNTATYLKNLGVAYFADKKQARGRDAFQKAFSADPQIFQQGGSQAVSEPTTGEQQADLDFTMAAILARAGLTTRALDLLQKALSEGFNDRKKLMQNADFAALRNSPRFAELLKELNSR